MSAIDAIIWLLKDGRWHDLEEITQRIALPRIKTELAISFLAEYDFIQLNKNDRRIKIQPATLQFMEEVQRLENETLNH